MLSPLGPRTKRHLRRSTAALLDVRLGKRAEPSARRSARRRRRRFAPCFEQRTVRAREKPSRLYQEQQGQDAKLAGRLLRLAVPLRAPYGLRDARRGSRRCKQQLERGDGGNSSRPSRTWTRPASSAAERSTTSRPREFAALAKMEKSPVSPAAARSRRRRHDSFNPRMRAL